MFNHPIDKRFEELENQLSISQIATGIVNPDITLKTIRKKPKKIKINGKINEGYIYFLYLCGRIEAIKIGKSLSVPEKRTNKIATELPVVLLNKKLLGYLKVSHVNQIEKALHHLLQEYCLENTECFEITKNQAKTILLKPPNFLKIDILEVKILL